MSNELLFGNCRFILVISMLNKTTKEKGEKMKNSGKKGWE